MKIDLNINLPKAYRELLDPAPFKTYHGGRGAAKSWAFADVLLLKGIQSPERVLCGRELQISIADSVHKLLSDRIAHYKLEGFYDVTQTSIKGLNGTEFIFKGLKHNAREIKSMEGITKVWLEEAENMSDSSWELLIPTVFRRPNSEIWTSFNNRKPTDPTYKRMVLYPPDGAIVKRVSWRDNPFFPDELNKQRLQLQKSDPVAYAHVWEGEFDERNFGGVYSKHIEAMRKAGRFMEDIYDPELLVYTAWDLGGDGTVIWYWQKLYNEIRLIDYFEDTLLDMDIYIEELQSKPYNYGKHYMPHDAANKLLAAGGRSIVMQIEHAMGLNSVDVIPATSLPNSEAAAKAALQFTWVDKNKCQQGLHSLMEYHYPWDEDRKKYKTEPLHDWSSHACDAYEIIGQVFNNDVVLEKPKIPDKLTFNDVFWADKGKKDDRI